MNVQPRRTLEEINSILSHIRKANLKAVEEYREMVEENSRVGFESRVGDFIQAVKRLIQKHAYRPSLRECVQQGAGFGDAGFVVTCLMNEVVLEQVQSLEGRFRHVLKAVLILVLRELDNPKHDYLYQALEQKVEFSVIPHDNVEISPEKIAAVKRQTANELLAAFITVGDTYGLMSGAEEGIQITDLGKRVLIHLEETQEYLTELSVDYTMIRKQTTKTLKI